jgi:WD40 repeat protein
LRYDRESMQQITADNAHQLVPFASARRGWITQVVWSPNGRALAVGGAAGVALYTSENLALRGALEGHGGHVKGVAVNPDGALLASSSADTTIRIWRLAESGGFFVLEGHQDSVEGVIFSPDGNLLASASADKTVRLWDVKTGETLAVFQAHRRSHRRDLRATR